MKKIFLALALLIGTFLFSQTSLPQGSPKGTIITKTNQTIEFKNLKYEKGKITYTDKYSNAEEFLYDNSVKSMSYYDNDGNIKSYEAQEIAAEGISGNNTNQTIAEQPKIPVKPAKLTSDNEIKNYLIQSRNQEYLKGKSLNNTGTLFLVGGAVCVAVGGILNLTSSPETPTITNQNPESKGSPVPLIIGLAGMAAGVVMKISGHSQMKKAVQNYKNYGVNKTSSSYYILADNKGLGLQMKF